MTLNKKSIERIKNLRGKGYSYKEIAKNLRISSATSYKYSKYIILSKKAKRRLDLKIKRNQLKLIKRNLKNIKIKHKKITIEKARILSHCLWDGSISRGTVRYSNTSKILVDGFKKDMLKVYGVFPDKEYSLVRENCQVLYMVDYYGKQICDNLLKYSPSFSTKSIKSTIPKQILLNKNKKILQEFLRALWEDEGSISCYGAIRVKIKGEHIRDQLVELHRKFGIELTPYKENNGCHGIYIKNNLQNLKKFNKICFRKASVVFGKNKGKLKYDVFNSLLNRKN